MVASTKKKRSFRSADGRDFQVSYFKIEGSLPGPSIALVAGQHGMEHIGPVMLIEFADQLIKEEDFKGTVYICPCANPLALEKDYEIYPEFHDVNKIDEYYYSIFRHDFCILGLERAKGDNGYNMNRLWNCDTPKRGVATEIIDWLWNEFVRDSAVVIDFHCLQAEKPMIYNWAKKNLDIIRFFGVEAVCSVDAPVGYQRGNLGFQSCKTEGHYGFCVEFSKQHGYKNEYDIGKQGIINVMKGIGMLEGEVVLRRPVNRVLAHHPLFTDEVGHIHYKFNEHDQVRKGDLVFEISSLETCEIIDRVFSPVDGIAGRRTVYPISRPGEKIVDIKEVEIIARAGEELGKISIP